MAEDTEILQKQVIEVTVDSDELVVDANLVEEDRNECVENYLVGGFEEGEAVVGE